MKSLLKSSVLALAAVLALTPAAQAWNNTGHEIVGLLAYQKLDAAQQKKILAYLADHPHYGEYFLAPKGKKAADLEDIAMRAATWSDWVRTHHKKQFHKANWHYINKPYVVASSAKKRKEIEDAFNKEKDHGEILKMIPAAAQAIGEPADTPKKKQDRAVMLCWLFHLVGDLHQPLHAVALCNEALPEGDRGGNSLYVSPKKGQAPRNLHTVWDHMLGDHKDVRGIVRDIALNVPVCKEERDNLASDAWADESLAIARRTVYNFRGKAIDFVIDESSNDGVPSSAPILPSGYLDVGEEIARQRVAVAGARLAELLKKSLGD
jgi:2-oxo-4-hydroxy-4-carboxy--5-ureidoimidazoline (OHCU) decarboxylase